MSVDEKIWELHDRRLNEHETRFNKGSENFQELKDALKQLTERINEGVSKTQHRILDEQKTIQLGMKDLEHKIDIDLLKMKEQNDAAHSSVVKRVSDLEGQQEKISNIYVWSIVGGVVAGLTLFGVMKATERFSSKVQTDAIEKIENLRSEPIHVRR